jgi:NitT/TauT family transport system ATP-binding protein
VASLTIRDVGYVYEDGTRALDGVNLRLSPGEIVAIVGPSGCGKSTLLRLVAGLVQPTVGTVDAPSEGIGVVFQQPTLLPWRTVRRNVALPLDLRGTSDNGAVDAVLRDVGLDDVHNKLPGQLSGGMQMRVAVARALVDRPDLVLLDEPFAAVDEMLRERLNDLFLKLRSARDFSALFVTHSIAEAVFISNRVAIMSSRPGRILSIVEVPFDGNRDSQLRYEPDFARLCGQISSLIRSTNV